MLFVVAALVAASAANAETCTMSIRTDTSCTFSAFNRTQEASATACCATCASAATCTAWEWWDADVPNPGKRPNCHLKTERGNIQHKLGSTCGSVAPFPPTPAPPTPLPPQPAAKPGSPNIVWFLTVMASHCHPRHCLLTCG
jgi:hypothetical protein